MTWTTPAGTIYDFYEDALSQPHLLIAGATGSGKSVIISGMIYTALYKSPEKVNFILLDPKRVELVQYKRLPHTVRYASEPADMINALRLSISIMEDRYRRMQKKGLRKSSDPDLYVIVDEYADLISVNKRQTKPLCQRIAQLGRAANVHLILATQRPTRDIVDGAIKVNMDSRIALRCPTPQDSRNIIDVKGAELLPKYGDCYYKTPDNGLQHFTNIPMIPEAELEARVKWWTGQNKLYQFICRLA